MVGMIELAGIHKVFCMEHSIRKMKSTRRWNQKSQYPSFPAPIPMDMELFLQGFPVVAEILQNSLSEQHRLQH